MYPDSLRVLQADALSGPALQRTDQLSVSQIWQAAVAALDARGGKGRVAQESGDNPETAAVRMRWARATAAVLDGQPAPGMRRVAADDGSAFGLTARRAPGQRSAMDDTNGKVTVMCTCKIYPDRSQPHNRTCSRHGH